LSEEGVRSLLSREPSLTTLEVSSKLKISRNTAIKLLEIMRTKGLVDYRRVGPAKLWFLKPSADEERIKAQEKAYKTVEATRDEVRERLAFSGPTVELIEKTLREMEKEIKRKKK